jgi:UDP-N-acetylmuramate--alanine ligase
MSARSAATVGAGLAAARRPRRITAGERIHVVGAAGAGASAAALLAHYAGGEVSGCDAGGPSPYSAALDAAGIPLVGSHDPSHVRGPNPPVRLAVTKALTAIDPNHAELAAARDAGIALEPWQQVVADAATGRTLVAVAGTHGKSTSAGWLTHVLVEAAADPSAFVGALLPATLTGGVPATARWGSGEAFVVEADEYAGNFDPYWPAVTLLTTIEWDHPDVFADQDAVIAAFEAWIRRAGQGAIPTLVANVGDPGVAALVDRLRDWDGRLVATAVVDDSGALGTDVRATITDTTPSGTTIAIAGLAGLAGDLAGLAGDLGAPAEAAAIPVTLQTAGRHNAANALGVAATAAILGIPAHRIASGLASFDGIGRRLERKGEARGVVVYDDYGHHPTAIRETIAAVRQREPGRRVWAVYEPLTYHRTAALLDAFADALSGADAVAIADIWAGRDPDMTVASAALLADAVAARRRDLVAEAPGSVEATADWLAGQVRSGDVVLVMGGGRSYRIGERLLEQLVRG